MSDNFDNKSKQNFSAENTQNQKVKLRLRLKSGEEFEAEGSLEFVLAKKEDFLNKTGRRTTQYSTQIIPSIQNPEPNIQPITKIAQKIEDTPPTPTFNDEISRIEKSSASELIPPQEPIVTSHIVTAEERLKDYNLRVPAIHWKKNKPEKPSVGGGRADTNASQTPWQIDERIWVKVAYIDGADIVIRRKIKDLKPNLAALITLAAAKMLAGVTKMTALELSKSMRLSGYLKGDERLDRILAPEIKAGTMFFEGSKRNREYMISNTGTAKAYTAAEHFLLA